MRTLILIILGYSTLSTALATDPQTFASGPKQIQLLELYTSEGCSSCPPADQWFSTLGQHPGLWTDFVPVAFHVTYWDYLGWKDRFSQKEFDQRQKDRAKSARAVVYTPGVFYGGNEYRRWRLNRAAPKAKANHAVGELTVEVRGNLVEARFEASDIVQPAQFELALLASNQETAVRAGENRGRTLAHDFVVAALKQHPLRRQDSVWTASFSLPENIEFEPNAIAAWVSTEDGVPLQATGGWLDQ